MNKFKKVLSFLYHYRRPVGLLVGSMMVMFGSPDVGNAVIQEVYNY